MKKIILYTFLLSFGILQGSAQNIPEVDKYEKDNLAAKNVVRKPAGSGTLFSSPRLTVQDFYPNPASDFLNVDYVMSIALRDAKIIISNVLGVRTLEVSLAQNITTKQISLTTLSPGVYFISVFVEGNHQITRRLVIKR